MDQIEQEISRFINMLSESYQVFKFDEPRFVLSLRPDKRIGADETWDRAEAALRVVLKRSGRAFTEAAGEGAFYGPKIDVFVPDALKREWQLGTVQLDFQLAERFDMEYVAEDGSRQRPVVIHRAMLGSIERFLGILIEHLGGAFPLWLSPVQAVVIPITDRHKEYGNTVAGTLRDAGLRVRLNDSGDRMNAKIRFAQLKKVPYMLVVGDREQEAGSVSVRTRVEGNLGAMNVEVVQARLTEEVRTRR